MGRLAAGSGGRKVKGVSERDARYPLKLLPGSSKPLKTAHYQLIGIFSATIIS